MKTKKHKVWHILSHILVGLVYILSFAIIFITDWGASSFSVDIEATIFTLTNPIKGTNTDVVNEAILYCVPRILIIVFIYVVYAIFDCRRKQHLYLHSKVKKFKFKINLTILARVAISVGCIVTLALSIFHVDSHFQLFDFIKSRMQVSKIYENYYVDPDSANISLVDENGKKKSLIYIYLESMETTYTSYQNGGKQDVCYIPNLVNLANENVSFSNNNNIGGFLNTSGTGWTMGSLLATSSGIPYSFPIDGNEMETRETFAPGLTSLGDVLQDFGYKQVFLCGSDAEFGGRKTYFKTHGNYEILDLYLAREKGYIDEDYYAWWGFEDKYLYEIAQKELLEISKNNQPFNFTMLTVDTHHKDGYLCELCGSEYENKTANVVSCADKQAYAFVEWCKKQDFYEDTIIVITGDHARMDTNLVSGAAVRAIYNCFINCKTPKVSDIKNRVFTPMDIFPTVLSGLGYKWEGNRLGLGTNLFSNQQTLAEELGFNNFNDELKKSSNYYMKHFF